MVRRDIVKNAVNVASSIAPPTALPPGVEIRASALSEAARVLTPAALSFVAKLHRTFESRRQDVLARRAERQGEFDAGKFLLQHAKELGRQAVLVLAARPLLGGLQRRKELGTTLHGGGNPDRRDRHPS